jgi:hypothetical protein
MPDGACGAIQDVLRHWDEDLQPKTVPSAPSMTPPHDSGTHEHLRDE